MKTRSLFLTVAATAVAAFTISSLNAAEPFLSPRANENQIRPVRGITESRLDLTIRGFPKAASLKPRTVSGVSGERLGRSHLTVSPRALDTFPWLAESTVRK